MVVKNVLHLLYAKLARVALHFIREHVFVRKEHT